MTSQKFLITFLVDHASPEVFFRMIDEGNAPYVSKYILGDKTPQNTYSKANDRSVTLAEKGGRLEHHMVGHLSQYA